VEACLSPFGDSGNLNERKLRGFVSNVPLDQKLSWTHPMELLREWVMWNLILVHLETVLVSVQYRCTVCAKRTLGSEIILDEPDDTLR
jgi:hypothetical protein